MNQTLARRVNIVPPFKLNWIVPSRRRWYSSDRAHLYKRYDGPIVISGISGRFPKCQNMAELTEGLLNGTELTSESHTRWKNDAHPKRFGFLHCLDKFDASFFNVTPRQAHQNDPQMRCLLEVVFEAFIDAGLAPSQMRGSRTAVFSGAYGNEAADYNLYRVNRDNAGYYQLAFANFMIPGRVSFAFDLQGPSSHMCTACSSSFTALETAVSSIMLGKCDAAVVTGSTIHLNPQSHLDLLAMNVLAKDGRCKTFDEKADGFARAEAAVAIVIQKEKDARRRYATILNIRSNSDGFKHEGVLYPNGRIQEQLLRETYEQVGVDPGRIAYMDAHGTGTSLGDPEELQAISDVFCKTPSRTSPLLVGSVKSNMGHTEAAAGLCSIAKTIVAIQSGTIPPNLHFNRPKPEQEHIFDGSIKIVSEPTPFPGGLIGISSFGIGGTNYHCILQPGPESKPDAIPPHDLPILLPISGRSEDKVQESIKEASVHGHNPEYTYLLQNAYQLNIKNNMWRGYGLLQKDQTEPLISIEHCEATLRPVWMIFPGMGSQWNEMGKDLMKIQAFAESVNRSQATLKNLGVDLGDLLKPNNQAIFDDIHYAVLSITAMQMALYDTIKELGLMPEGFIGHSTGEFLCAYADGCFTAEETLMVADARGRAFKESRKVIGGMASVGLSWDEVKARIPEDLELACHNAAQNVTVSGPIESVTKFVKELKDEGKFAVVVNSCGIAAHSRHVQDAADLLKKYVAETIKGERARTARWISTSIPESEWESPMAKFASPEYFDNNLRAPVLFYEALQHVPSKALVIEVSPKGFFQAILKESVPKDCVHVAPMTVKAEDKLSHFFQSIGQMYLSGVDVEMDKLYPAVATPVSCNTPALSHLVRWDHEMSWKTHMLDYPLNPGYEIIMDIQHPNYAHLTGHKLEDRILFPATGYLQLIWLQFCENQGKFFEKVPVVFTNVILQRATIVHETRESILMAMLSGGGKFEFSNDGDMVVTGQISHYPEGQANWEPAERDESEYLPLNTHDIYKEFRLRGYNYSGLFQGIQRIDNEGRWADLAWTGNWTSFLDTMLQTSILCTTKRNLALPVDFERIVIDPMEFLKHIKEPEEGQEHPTVRVSIYPYQNKIQCPGIELKGLQATIVARKGQRGNLAYEKYAFCPFVESSNLDTEPHLWELVDLVLENNRSKDLKVVDVFTKKENSLAGVYQQILNLKPLRESDIRMLTLASEVEKMEDNEKSASNLMSKETAEELIPEVAADLAFLDDPGLLTSVSSTLKPNGFLLVHSEQAALDEIPGMSVISKKSLASKTLTLLRKIPTEEKAITHIAVDNANFSWLAELQEVMAKAPEEAPRVFITSQSNINNGVLGLVNCLRQEEGGERVRCIVDPEKTLQLDFTSPNDQLKTIIQNDLVMNVTKNKSQGTYRHVPLEAETNGVTKTVEHAYVSTLTPGDLTSLRWIESPHVYFERNQKLNPNPNQKLYKVAYSALNFRDVLLATGTIPIDPNSSYKEAYIGFEFSGFDENGQRVMGLKLGSALATTVVTDPNLVFPIPEGWTLEQAAAVPVVYATVLYAFHKRANIRRGQTVLIHAGTGGVGQAAISVALAQGCKVLTTVGTPEKRALIKKLYPEITDECIGNSRDTSFEAQFMELTKGRGVDIVMNSLADDKLMATVRCLAVNGKFLEIGVYDAFKNTPLGMRPFLKNIDFQGVELYHVVGNDPDGAVNLHEMFNEGLKSGAIRPMPTHVFEKDQLEEAFRFMASGKHAGKILIKVRDEETYNEPMNLPAVGRCYFPHDKSYLIVGGLGGLGLEVANWLVDRGARHLILTSRSGLTTGYQSLCLRKWKNAGVTVETPVVDLSNKEAAATFMKELSSKHSVGGVFNSALVLKDETFSSQTVELFEEVSAPKGCVTQNLDELTRQYCKDLDYFVVFSSSACGRGNADQTNYGWANAVMERICEKRMEDGLHGLAIQWGVLGQVGIVAEKIFKNMDGTEVLMGTLPQNVESCLEVLDAALQQRNPLASSIVVAEKGKKKGDKAGLMARMAKIFGIKDVNSLSPDKKLTELGMDSLIGVELKQTLEREYDMPVTKELLLSLTVGDLKAIDAGTFSAERAAAKSRLQAGDLNVVPFILHEDCLVKLNDNDSTKHLFIVHGIEGGADIFQPLASKLNCNVYGLQYGEHAYTYSIPSIAEAYVNEIKAIKPKGPYQIAGYSAGGSIAYEIVSQLQDEHGEVVSDLIFLDGCPSWEGGDREAKCKTLCMGLARSRNLLKDLPEDKINQFENALSGDIDADAKTLADLATQVGGLEVNLKSLTCYLRLGNAVADYFPDDQYKGKTTLVQASLKSDQSLAMPNEDYNISQYCVGHVTRHKVDGDHMNFLTEEYVDATATILNEVLA